MAPGAADVVRFYFSFRSPYAWLALHRMDQALKGLPVTIELIPVYPPDDMPNNPTNVPNKMRYMGRDFLRIAQAYGLRVQPPASLDTDWARAHAPFLWADEQGKGEAYAREAFSARWQRGQDLADDEVIAAVARACGLDPEGACAAAANPDLQDGVRALRDKGFTEDGLFGVPYFVYRDESFWGNDRLDWLVRSIQTAQGIDVPELRGDLMARPQA